MTSAKDILIQRIGANDAARICRALHYSGGVKTNSQLHLGAFIGNRCGGVMSFGPSIDKKRMIGLVRDTAWNGFVELNRMAFSEWMPRNGESRSLAMAFRYLRKHAPHVEWIVSFADATRCGDGGIYRASGFVLTQIKRNTTMVLLPDGRVVANKTLGNDPTENAQWWRARGAVPLAGFQLRYVYFLNPDARARLTVPEVPFSAIAEAGASMYRGKKRAGSDTSDTPGDHPGEGGAAPTSALSSENHL